MKGKGGNTIRNTVAEGFLKKYRHGKGLEAVYIPLAVGVLRLEYDGNGPFLLSRVSFVADGSEYSPAIGNLLEFGLSRDEADEEATFIAEEGVSGVQWSGGRARWGHTYDDDSPPPEGRVVDFGSWVDECVNAMINPPEGILKEVKDRYDLAGSFEKIMAGDEKARDRFWKKCSPRTLEEAVMVLDLLKRAIAGDDGDILFSCCDPLKRAKAGISLILEELTGMLETGSVATDYDRSELQEVLAAHAAKADPATAARWRELCAISFKVKGHEALHAINEGSLFIALSRVPGPGGEIMKFIGDVIGKIESSPAEISDDVKSLLSFSSLKKALQRS